MAAKRQPEAKQSDDDEQSASEAENTELQKSDSESESEEEDEDRSSAPILQKPYALKHPQTPQTHSHPQSSSSDESDSPHRPYPKIKSMEELPAKAATKKPRSKPGSTTPVAKSAGAGASPAKRQVETENKSNRESKRAKRKDSGVEEDTAKKTGDDSKKRVFQRLWSDDDEIAILKGMIEYASKTGVQPGADMNGFHEFVKKSLHADFTKTQLYEKVRRLRLKYENNLRKRKEGEDPAFSKAHEQKTYEFSKKIWGNSGADDLGNGGTKVNESVRKSKSQRARVASPKEGEKIEVEKMEPNTEIIEPDAGGNGGTKVNESVRKSRSQRARVASPKGGEKIEVEKMEPNTEVIEPNAGVFRSIGFYGSIGGLGLNEEIVKAGLDLISHSNKLELEGKWNKLRVEEMELYMKRVELMREQTKLVLEALNSSGD